MNMRKANTIKSTGYILLALCFSHFYATGAMACAEQLGNQLGAKINELNAAEVNYLTGAAASCAKYKNAGKAYIDTFDQWTQCIGVDQSASSSAYKKAKKASGLDCK